MVASRLPPFDTLQGGRERWTPACFRLGRAPQHALRLQESRSFTSTAVRALPRFNPSLLPCSSWPTNRLTTQCRKSSQSAACTLGRWRTAAPAGGMEFRGGGALCRQLSAPGASLAAAHRVQGCQAWPAALGPALCRAWMPSPCPGGMRLHSDSFFSTYEMTSSSWRSKNMPYEVRMSLREGGGIPGAGWAGAPGAAANAIVPHDVPAGRWASAPSS